MAYTCSVCSQKISGDLIVLKDHTDKHIVDLVKYDHPQWVEADGMCEKCYEYYKAEIAGSIFKDAPCAIRIRKGSRFIESITGLFKPKAPVKK